MKIKAHLFGSFLLFVLTVFLPWFTFNAKVMGYCWGWHFLKYLAGPIIVIAIYLWNGKGKWFAILAELAAVIILIVYVIAFGRWQEFFHIAPGFQWMEGFHTATAGYWFSVAAYGVFAFFLQMYIFRNKSK